MRLNSRILKLLLIAGAVAGINTLVLVTAHEDAGTQALIESAMSAAPLSVSAEATIYDNAVDENGKPVVLREGTNGWVCYPDYAGSPHNDPSCYDEAWQSWNDALGNGTEPSITRIGLAYMLQGGSETSMDEPLGELPEGQDWIYSPPHIMIIVPPGMEMPQYGSDHTTGEPYLMWANTPYRHYMVPVSMDEMEHAD
jgi:hypothetical protein